jgi:hypothetical protein
MELEKNRLLRIASNRGLGISGDESSDSITIRLVNL